jgi:hypothetical protein
VHVRPSIFRRSASSEIDRVNTIPSMTKCLRPELNKAEPGVAGMG